MPPKAYEEAVATGRCIMCNFDLGDTNLVIAILYGWTGGKNGNEAAARTDDLLTVVQQEFEAMDLGPKMIMGDINATTDSLPTILQMMAEGGWTDVGWVAHICNGEPNRPTCHANGDAKESRIDFIFVNEYLLPAIEECWVDEENIFATHRPLGVRIKTERIAKQLKTLRKTTNFAELLETKILQVATGEAEQADEGKAVNEAKTRKRLTEELHDEMDKQVEESGWRMDHAIIEKVTNTLWALITSAAESANIILHNLTSMEAVKMRGRAKVTLQAREEKFPGLIVKRRQRKLRPSSAG